MTFYRTSQQWWQFLEANTLPYNTKKELERQRFQSEMAFKLERLFAKQIPEFVDSFESTYADGTTNEHKDGDLQHGVLVLRCAGRTGEEMDEAVENLFAEAETTANINFKTWFRKGSDVWTVTLSGSFNMPKAVVSESLPVIPKERIREETYTMKNGKTVTMKSVLPERRVA